MYIIRSYDEFFILKMMCKELYLKVVFTAYNFTKLENCG